MHDHSNAAGIYNDIENEWAILMYRNSYVELMHNGRWELATRSGYGLARGSMRAPVFYDSNDSGYYLDPNTTSNSALRIRGGTLHGPNPSWGRYLAVGTNGHWSTSYASVATTNGNLHLDSRGGYGLYLQWYVGGTTYVNGAMQVEIMYDRNNTGYYFNADNDTNWQGLTTYGKMRIGLTGKSNYRRNNYTGDSRYWTGAMGWGRTDLISMFDQGSGFIDTWSNPANQPAGTSHWVGVQASHFNGGYNYGYGIQIVGGPIQGLWHTSYWSSKRRWYKIAMYDLNEYSYNMWANLYYDSDNSYYYMNPSGFSRISQLRLIDGNDFNIEAPTGQAAGVRVRDNSSSRDMGWRQYRNDGFLDSWWSAFRPAMRIYANDATNVQGRYTRFNNSPLYSAGVTIKNDETGGRGSNPSVAISRNYTNGGGLIQFHNLNYGYSMGHIAFNGTTRVRYNTSYSDSRLKTNVQSWDGNALDLFEDITPVTFNYVHDHAETPDEVKGFIAQDEFDKFPEAFPMGEDEFHSFAPGEVVVYLMKAMKEAAVKLKEQEARIETLESQVQQLISGSS